MLNNNIGWERRSPQFYCLSDYSSNIWKCIFCRMGTAYQNLETSVDKDCGHARSILALVTADDCHAIKYSGQCVRNAIAGM